MADTYRELIGASGVSLGVEDGALVIKTAETERARIDSLGGISGLMSANPSLKLKYVTLIGGQEDEATPVGHSASVTADLTNFEVGTQGWAVTATSSGNSTP